MAIQYSCLKNPMNRGAWWTWGHKELDTTKWLSMHYLTLLLFSCWVVSDSLWPPWTVACHVSLSFTISWNLLKFMSIGWMMLSNHLMVCHRLFLLLSIFPSIKIFSNEGALPIRWPKYWSFSFSISPSSEYSGWFPFRIDWLISKWAAIPFSGDLPDPGIEPGSPALQVDSLLSEPPGKPYDLSYVHVKITFSLSIHPLIITLVFSMFDYCE